MKANNFTGIGIICGKKSWNKEWDNTAYIHCSDLDIIEHSLITLFGQEGHYPVPTSLRKLGCDAMQINLYDGTDIVLLEADSSDCIAISSMFSMADDDPFV